MGVSSVKWRCPKCNVDVGGSMGELKNHMKRVHSPAQAAKTTETRVASAA